MRFRAEQGQMSWLTARPIAHRGLHDKSEGVVENSRSAFAGAIARNYAIECDLQLTSDGEAIVFHDEALHRLTEAEGRVIERTAAEVTQIKLRGSNDTPQLLSDLLEQVAGQVPLVIELKSHWDGNPALAARALAVLEGYAGPYCLMSFDSDLVRAVREISPLTYRGIVADRTVDPEYNALPLPRRVAMRTFSHFEETQPHFVSFYARELPWEPVTRFRAEGGPVITWTIRSEDQARRARRYSDQITFEGFHP